MCLCYGKHDGVEVEANSLDFKDFFLDLKIALIYNRSWTNIERLTFIISAERNNTHYARCFKTIHWAILTKLSMLTKAFILLTYNFEIFKHYNTSYFH